MSNPLTFNYGGGINSGSMILGCYERQIRPAVMHFADCGRWMEEPAEQPETYLYIERMIRWCEDHDFTPITVVRHDTDTLYRSCERNGTLPSKAYGFPGCSVKFKHQIIERAELALFGPDQILEKAIGYHAGEERGSSITEKGRYRYRYFLKEWGWYQEDCVEAFGRHGLPVPPKSSCFFCPSMKVPEIRRLHQIHPELFAKAIAMEHFAKPYHERLGNTTKGLARGWSWEQLISADEAQMNLFSDPPAINCMCDDGDDLEP